MGTLKKELGYERDDEFDPDDYYNNPNQCEHCSERVSEPGLCSACYRQAEREWMDERAREWMDERTRTQT